jgi:hypothetical protein
MKILFAILVLVMISFMALCQTKDSQELVKIETKDGNEYYGVIVFEDDEKIILKTEVLGEITLRKEIIVRRKFVDISKLVEGELWDDNPQSSRYLWTPNGYGLKKGEAYYQNIWVLYNQVSVGLTNYFSISTGIIPLFFFGGEILGPVWVVPKFSIPIKEDALNMSAGAFLGTVVGISETGFGIVFSTLTLGNKNSNWNFGLGWGFTGSDWSDRPIVNISGIHRISARGYILTENYYLTFDEMSMVILSIGRRHMSKKIGIDFGLYFPISRDLDRLVAFPLVGITIPFNN